TRRCPGCGWPTCSRSTRTTAGRTTPSTWAIDWYGPCSTPTPRLAADGFDAVVLPGVVGLAGGRLEAQTHQHDAGEPGRTGALRDAFRHTPGKATLIRLRRRGDPVAERIGHGQSADALEATDPRRAEGGRPLQIDR